MVKIQIGDVFGDLQEVALESSQTVADALEVANIRVGNTQQLLRNSNSQPVNLTDTVVDNEVYLLTTNQESGQ